MTVTPSELKAQMRDTVTHFFERETMEFFGDKLNYGVRLVVLGTWTGSKVPVWELYRKRPAYPGRKETD